MRSFLHLFTKLYPCSVCAGHFQVVVRENPINVTNHDGLVIWACKVHNIVNDRLRKPRYVCRREDLDERWGSCGCGSEKKRVGARLGVRNEAMLEKPKTKLLESKKIASTSFRDVRN